MGHPSDLPVGELLLTVFNSILEVFLLCLAGYILARKGVLDKKTQKQLNKINVNLFTPALLFSKVAFFLSPSKLRELYIIPIFFLAATFVSLLISYLLSTAFKLKRTQRNFAIAAAMFMNSNSLPIALMQSLVGSVKGLKWKKNGEDGDTKDAMLGRALTYLVLASTMGMILRWSFGVRLLAAADDPTPPPSPTITYNHQPLSSNAGYERGATEGLVPSTSSATLVQDTPPNANLRPPQFRRNTTYYRSFPNTPNQEFLSLPSEGSSRRESVVSLLYEPNEDEEALPGPATPAQPQHPTHSIVKRICRCLRRSLRSFMQFMTPPLWASLLSLVVAMVPPLQQFLAEDLGPVRGMLDKAGGCSIPVTLVVLGGYFCEEPKETGESAKADTKSKPIDGRKSLDADTLVGSVRGLFTRRKPHSRGKIYLPTDQEEDLEEERLLSFSRISTSTQSSRLEREQEEEKRKRKGETKTVVIAIISRMILCPIVLVPAVVYGAKGGFGGVFEDPIFTLSLLLLLCSPPALTLAQITQAASGDAFERLISKTIFWSYVVVTPPVMVGVVVGGVLVGRV